MLVEQNLIINSNAEGSATAQASWAMGSANTPAIWKNNTIETFSAKKGNTFISGYYPQNQRPSDWRVIFEENKVYSLGYSNALLLSGTTSSMGDLFDYGQENVQLSEPGIYNFEVANRSFSVEDGIVTDTSSIISTNFDSATTGSPPDTNTAKFSWTGLKVVAENEQSVSGTKSLRLNYVGNPNLDAQSSNEMRFELSKLYKELTFEFNLYIPPNYTHRDGTTSSSDNNKFLRLWPENYNDVEKIGFSTVRQPGDDSTIGSDYVGASNSSLSTAVTRSTDFITDADKGQWMEIKIEGSAPTATGTGFERLYKNGILFLEQSLPTRGYDQPGYRYGYLFGYANSGFTEDTNLYIDDFNLYSRID